MVQALLTRGDQRPKIQYGPPSKRLKRLLHHNTDSNPTIGTSSSSYGCSVKLPDDLVEYIFTLLPIKNAIQTSLVAKRFSHSWHLGRRLDFNKEYFDVKFNQIQLCQMVKNVFKSHISPEIKSFKLRFDPKIFKLDLLEEWLAKCIEGGVEELDFDLCLEKRQPHFSIPPSYVDVETLKVLKLSYSVFHLPPDLKGLSLLTTLVLRRVKIAAGVIETIFDRCALLETLDMGWCEGFRYLRIDARKQKRFRELKVGNCGRWVRGVAIDAPNLRSLYYTGTIGNFQLISRTGMLLLNEAMLNFKPSVSLFTNPWHAQRLASTICMVEVLTITSTFLEGLSPRIIDENVRETQFSFWNLKELQLILENPSHCNEGGIASFLKNCPGLEKLFIDLTDFTFYCGVFGEMHPSPQVAYNNLGFFIFLKFIKITGFRFESCYLDLVKFLLGRAVFLESMVLVLPKRFRFTIALGQEINFYTNIFHSCKISAQASISVHFASEDKTLVHPKQSKAWY